PPREEQNGDSREGYTDAGDNPPVRADVHLDAEDLVVALVQHGELVNAQVGPGSATTTNPSRSRASGAAAADSTDRIAIKSSRPEFHHAIRFCSPLRSRYW